MDTKRQRARELGVVIGSLPTGKYNAITDVSGIRVGHTTVIKGEGPLTPGKGPVRTGVTAVMPPGEDWFSRKLIAATHIINGFGKPIGLAQIAELGQLETPIVLTNTLNVGIAADALVQYMIEKNPEIGITTGTVNVVVGECNDGYLNDIQGRHVCREHVFQAIEMASGGAIPEGAVGAGTGMSCFGFKGGIGTASRRLPLDIGGYTVGVLLLANYGRRDQLIIAGVPVGRLIEQDAISEPEKGSVMIIMATDAPTTARQLQRIAKRAELGLARTGSLTGHGSGDFVIAFSTSNRIENGKPLKLEGLPETGREGYEIFDLMFQAVIEATEEAVINALFMAHTMEGRDNHLRKALPVDRVLSLICRVGKENN